MLDRVIPALLLESILGLLSRILNIEVVESVALLESANSTRLMDLLYGLWSLIMTIFLENADLVFLDTLLALVI